MSKPACHSRLSSTSTTPDLDINNIQLENLMDLRNTNDRRFNNVRNVLRKFFGNYNKKFSSSINPTVFDDNLPDQSSTINDSLISPILIHSCLQFNKHKKFSGRIIFKKNLI
jgi:hypothetical protein